MAPGNLLGTFVPRVSRNDAVDQVPPQTAARVRRLNGGQRVNAERGGGVLPSGLRGRTLA